MHALPYAAFTRWCCFHVEQKNYSPSFLLWVCRTMLCSKNHGLYGLEFLTRAQKSQGWKPASCICLATKNICLIWTSHFLRLDQFHHEGNRGGDLQGSFQATMSACLLQAFHMTGEKTEAQRGGVIFLRPPSHFLRGRGRTILSS